MASTRRPYSALNRMRRRRALYLRAHCPVGENDFVKLPWRADDPICRRVTVPISGAHARDNIDGHLIVEDTSFGSVQRRLFCTVRVK